MQNQNVNADIFLCESFSLHNYHRISTYLYNNMLLTAILIPMTPIKTTFLFHTATDWTFMHIQNRLSSDSTLKLCTIFLISTDNRSLDGLRSITIVEVSKVRRRSSEVRLCGCNIASRSWCGAFLVCRLLVAVVVDVAEAYYTPHLNGKTM